MSVCAPNVKKSYLGKKVLDDGEHGIGHPCTTRWAGVSGPTFGELLRVPQILLEDVRPVFVTFGHPLIISGKVLHRLDQSAL